jgi:hypothetical protein
LSSDIHESGDNSGSEDHLINAKITFLIITPNYKESEVCMNEMGAAWVTSGKVIPMILEPITYSTVGVIQQPKQVEKILNENSLDRIKDVVQEQLAIPPKEIRSDRWTTKKKEFITKVTLYLEANPFDAPLSREEYVNVIDDRKKLEVTVRTLVSDKQVLEKMYDDLKKKKDKKDVIEVEKAYVKKDDFEEFKKLCKNVEEHLSLFGSVVIGIIYKSYSGKQLRIGWKGNETELDYARSREYITDELDADWHTTREMRELHSALDELETFIREIEGKTSSFDDWYDAAYKSPLKLSNLDFWEEALNVTVSLD